MLALDVGSRGLGFEGRGGLLHQILPETVRVHLVGRFGSDFLLEQVILLVLLNRTQHQIKLFLHWSSGGELLGFGLLVQDFVFGEDVGSAALGQRIVRGRLMGTHSFSEVQRLLR